MVPRWYQRFGMWVLGEANYAPTWLHKLSLYAWIVLGFIVRPDYSKKPDDHEPHAQETA